jgi:hypothetical protein
MRVDLLDGGNALRAREQVLLHAKLDLAADAKRRGEQEVERAADRAFGRVLDRHDGELRGAGLAAAERFVDRCRRSRIDRAAEMLAHRLLAEGALGAEVGHADRLFQPAARRDDLPKHRRDALRRQGACLARNSSQDLGLAFRAISGRALLQRADVLREAGPALEQRRQLVIQAVDFAAQFLDFVSH